MMKAISIFRIQLSRNTPVLTSNNFQLTSDSAISLFGMTRPFSYESCKAGNQEVFKQIVFDSLY